jgi:zinc transporter ZupT
VELVGMVLTQYLQRLLHLAEVQALAVGIMLVVDLLEFTPEALEH